MIWAWALTVLGIPWVGCGGGALGLHQNPPGGHPRGPRGTPRGHPKGPPGELWERTDSGTFRTDSETETQKHPPGLRNSYPTDSETSEDGLRNSTPQTQKLTGTDSEIRASRLRNPRRADSETPRNRTQRIAEPQEGSGAAQASPRRAEENPRRAQGEHTRAAGQPQRSPGEPKRAREPTRAPGQPQESPREPQERLWRTPACPAETKESPKRA